MSETRMSVPRGLDHAGVTVRDLDRSVAFYAGLLGLEVIEISDGHSGHVVGLPQARMRIADLAIGDGRLLELIEYTAAGSLPSPQAPNAPGCPHIGLRVADLDQMITTLERVGYPPLGETLHVTAGLAWAGARVAYVRDPDGALVELVQRPESHNLT